MKNKQTLAEKKSQILSILRECYAIKTIACRKARISRTQFYNWLEKDLDFALKVQEIEESFIDLVECNLIEMVQLKDRTATMFFLKAKAKHRGYR